MITRGPSQGESGGGIQLGIGKVQLAIGHPAGPDHGGGTHAGWSIGGSSQALSQPVPAFDKEGAPIPNPGCAVRKSQVSEDVSGFFEPGTRGPNVCKLAGQAYQPVTRSVRVAEFVSGPDQLEDIPGVQFTRGLLVAGFGQALEAELANCFEHQEARFSARIVNRPDKARIDQRAHPGEGIDC